MRKQMTLKRIILTAAVLTAALLMTSCPQQITAPMVALVEDTLPPTLNISSPKGGDSYYSTVTITGFISDDVLIDDDKSGQITSIYYEIANDDFRKGKIDIGLDNQVTADTSFGSGTIDLDILTGEFEFTFSTISPNTLRDLLSLTITTVDRNNNETVEQLNLSESKGPHVDFSFYSSGDYNDASKITSLAGDRVYIGGNIANSDYQLDTAEEIVSITWTVAGTSLGATLDITPDSSDWLEASAVFQTSNAFEDTEFFRYDPETKKFYTETFIDVEEGSKNFQVSATDAYGHSTTIDRLLTPPASLMMSTPTASRTYYATDPYQAAARIINFSSKLTDPNDGILSFSQIASVQCSFTSTAQETAPDSVSVYTITDEAAFNTFFNIPGDPGRFSFDITTANWPSAAGVAGDGGNIIDLTGDIYAKITVEDEKGKTKNKSVLIQKDTADPSISNISFTGGTSGYLKRDDTVSLSFTATDALSGVSGVDRVLVNGQDVTGSITPSGSNYSVNYTIPSGATSDANGTPVGYDIRLYDDAGNEATNINASAKTFYGPYSSNSYSISSSTAATNTGNTTWARASGSPVYDTVTVNFTSPRLLTEKPIVTLGGRTVLSGNVTYNSATGACTAALIMNGSETTPDLSLIPISVLSTDIVGNTETLQLNSAVSYDGTAPTSPTVPTWPASPDNYVNIAEAGNNITISAAYAASGAITGDTVKLYMGSTSGTLLGSTGWEADYSADFTFAGTTLGANGVKNIISHVIDEAGNEGAASPVLPLTVDKTVPVAEAGDSYDAGTSKINIFNQDAAAGFEASDLLSGVTVGNISWTVTTLSGDGTCNYSKNAGTGAIEISSFSTSGATADGEYQADLTVEDTAGNISTDSFTFTLDAVPLLASFSGISTTYVNATPLNLTSTVSGDESGTPTYSWDTTTEPGGAVVTFGSAASADTTLSSDTDGAYVVELIVTDQLGRAVTATSADYDFIRETTPPAFTTVSPGDIGSINLTYPITAVATDGGSGVNTGTYQWNVTHSGSNDYIVNSATLSVSHLLTGVQDGSYTAVCTVDDVAGNESDPNLSFIYTWDSQPPALDGSVTVSSTGTLNSGTRYNMQTDSLTLSFDLTDLTGVNNSAVSVRIFDTGDSGYIDETFTGITPSGNTYSVTHDFTTDTSDADGTTINYTVYVEDTLSSPNTGTISSGTISDVLFYGPYSGNSYTGSPDFSSDNSVNSSWARATSTAYDELTVEFTSTRVLNADPTVTIAGKSASVSKSGLTYTATYQLDGSESLSEGDSIPFAVSFSDAAGNSDSIDDGDTATVIYYDDVLPSAMNDCTLNDADAYINNDELTNDTISLIVNYGTSGATTNDRVELYLDSISAGNLLADTAVTNTTSQTVTIDKSKLVSDGLKIIRARVVDEAGNNGGADNSTPFTVDTVIDTCDAGADHIDAGSETSAFNQSSEDAGDSLSGLDSRSWSFSPACTYTDNGPTSLEAVTASSGDGTYVGTLTVTDIAGNVATSDFTFVWDATPLTASITGVTSGAYINSLHLTAVDTDGESGVQSYAWSATTKPGAAGESFTPTNGEETDFDANKDGYYVVQVIIEDNLDRTDTATIDFTWDTTAPVINSITTTGGTSGADAVFTADIDEDNPKTYSWTLINVTAGNIPVTTGWSAPANILTLTTYTDATQYRADLTISDECGYSDNDSAMITTSGSKSISSSTSASTLSGGSPSAPGSLASGSNINTYNFEPEPTNTSSTVSSSNLTQARPASYSRVNTYDGKLYTSKTSNSPENTELSTIETKDSIESEIIPVELNTEKNNTTVMTTSSAPKAASSALIKKTATVETTKTVAPTPKRNGAAALLLLIPGAAAAVLIYRKRKL